MNGKIKMAENEKIITNIPNIPVKVRSIIPTPELLYSSLHFHQEIEIIKVAKGSVNLTVNGTSMAISEGTLAIINCNVIHCISYREPNTKFSYFQFDVYEYLKSIQSDPNSFLFEFISLEQTIKYMIFDSSSTIYNLFCNIENESIDQSESYEVVISAYIKVATVLFKRYQILNNTNLLKSDNKDLSKLLPILEYIEFHYQEQLTLDSLSNSMFLSKYNICRLFASALNTTFVNYMNYRRLKHAEQHLLNTKLNMIDIALDSGFMSIQYFNRCFKKKHGITPYEYRKLNEKKPR